MKAYKKKVMKGNTLQFYRRPGEHLASPSLHMVDDSLPIILYTNYSFLLHFVSNVDKERPPIICKALYLFLDCKVDN